MPAPMPRAGRNGHAGTFTGDGRREDRSIAHQESMSRTLSPHSLLLYLVFHRCVQSLAVSQHQPGQLCRHLRGANPLSPISSPRTYFLVLQSTGSQAELENPEPKLSPTDKMPFGERHARRSVRPPSPAVRAYCAAKDGRITDDYYWGVFSFLIEKNFNLWISPGKQHVRVRSDLRLISPPPGCKDAPKQNHAAWPRSRRKAVSRDTDP